MNRSVLPAFTAQTPRLMLLTPLAAATTLLSRTDASARYMQPCFPPSLHRNTCENRGWSSSSLWPEVATAPTTLARLAKEHMFAQCFENFRTDHLLPKQRACHVGQLFVLTLHIVGATLPTPDPFCLRNV